MAIYHCTTKPLSRSAGRSAVAAAAYRSGESLHDERTGLPHNYTNKSGVMQSYTLLPSGESCDRSELWNAAEAAEKRKDARTAREWIVAIPSELVPKTKLEELWNGNNDQELVKEFAQHLSETFGVAVDVAIHAPDAKGDNRNYHAHILTTTRTAKLENDKVTLGNKATIELSDKKRGELILGKAKNEVKNIREVWANLANKKLEQANEKARIDHRSFKDRGIDQVPQIHVGVTANSMERKGKSTDRGSHNNEIKKLNAEIIDLQKVREHRQEVQRRRAAREKETQKLRQEKQQEANRQRENQARQQAEQEQLDRQKEAERLSPENIEKTYTELFNQVQEKIRIEEKALMEKVASADALLEEHREQQPREEQYASKIPLAGYVMLPHQDKKYDAAVTNWKAQQTKLRTASKQSHQQLNQHQNKPAYQVANEAFKKQYPAMHKEWERLKAIEREQLDKEREAKRKDREQARKAQRRSRSRGRGGLSR